MSFVKGAMNLKLLGHAAANRDAEIRLRNEATGEQITRKPFLDGSLVVRDIDPGQWQVEVIHPNLIEPLFQDRVRVIPQPRPIYVPVPVPSTRFEDNPIRDLPDADLTPIQQSASAVRSAVAPIAGKAPGEVIRADDWNQLVAAVSDLAGSVLELTRLVSPSGHDHPEIAAKIDEVQGNIRRFVESFGRSLLELRRDIENQSVRRATTDMLDLAGVVGPARDSVLRRMDDLELSLQATPTEFTRKMSATGAALASEVNRIATTQGTEAEVFLAAPETKRVLVMAEQLSTSGVQTAPEEELETYRRTGLAAGGSKFTFATRR
jgi:hypothetical protein